MIFGRSRKRDTADLPMTPADPVEPQPDEAQNLDSRHLDSRDAETADAQPTPATASATPATDSPSADDTATTAPPVDAPPVDAPAAPAAPEPAAIEALDRAEHGPHDLSEITDREGYLDLGAVLIKPVPGVMLRLEVQEATNRVLAAILDLGESSVQLQAFAAPRSAGLWDEVREQIAADVVAQSGQAHEVHSHFGTELLAAVPAVAGADAGLRVARFIGIDGPRWFLRGVITGAAATDEDRASAIEALFRDVVVVRGTEAMAPRDLLTLTIPGTEEAGGPGDGSTPPGPPERGPEVTQIG
ncbi:hypothetical protein GCM10011512_27900 [Tersicoccus solisilvae]|uniref:DUF3710 domain-containing protein n=1 Tax=Tersicoccus solisilvae TaxID=1882339 RepID=A0ABQ1PMB1_9MICC|nr:DUF3710 domain-containing protein [Tersicoccus solisilvae]GGC99392.1 hypothetical protein GCM10011512_27900 [Tersicoccus solisilvae]